MDDRRGRRLAAGRFAAIIASAILFSWPPIAGRAGRAGSSRQVGPASPQAPPGREDNPGLFNEMGKMLEKSLSVLPTLKSPSEAIDDLNARAKDAAKDAGESLSRLATPSSMVTGRVICPASSQRRAGLQGRRRQALPGQGLQGGQEPQCRFRGSLFCESADSRPDTEAGRLPYRLLRHPRAVPVAPEARSHGPRSCDCFLGMMSGILCLVR